VFATLLLCCSAPPAAPAALSEPAAAALVAKLCSDDREVSAAALKEFTAAGAGAKAAVPALVKLLAPNHAKQYEALDALRAIGPGAKDALPALLALFPKEHGSGYDAERVAITITAIDGYRIECTRALLITSAKCAPIYLEQSSLLHSHAPDVVRHLCALCADKDAKVRGNAARVLEHGNRHGEGKVREQSLFERAGDAAKLVPAALEKLLADSDAEVRLAGAQAAAAVAPALTDKAVAAVIELAHERVGNTKGGVYAAPVFAYAPERAAEHLIPLFDSPNEALREWAVQHAGGLNARGQLESALKNGTTVRARAGAARALGGRNAEAVPALAAALKDGAFEVRFAAAEALTRVGGWEVARTAGLPVFVEALRAADANTRGRACDLLVLLRADAKAAVPDIQKLLKDPVREVQFTAALALVGIDAPNAAGAVPVLTAALGDTVHDSRAAAALGTLGPVAKAAVPELVKHFEAKSAHLRIECASAAARIDPARAPDAVKVLAAVLQDAKLTKGMPRIHAAQALAQIGAPAKAAVPVLAPLLTDDNPFHAEIAVAMLAIDPESAPAREWIRKTLARKLHESEDTYDLFDALPNAPAACAALVPDLLPLLTAKEHYVRASTAKALGAAGPAAQAALPKLKELAEKDPATAVRRNANEAVAKVEAK